MPPAAAQRLRRCTAPAAHNGKAAQRLRRYARGCAACADIAARLLVRSHRNRSQHAHMLRACCSAYQRTNRTKLDGRAAIAGPSGGRRGRSARYARQAALFWRRRPPPPRLRGFYPHPKAVCAPGRAALRPVLFALFACCRAAALRLLPSPAPARRARRRFAGPVRRFRPRAFSALAGPAPRPLRPRLCRSARAARCALAGRSLPPGRCGFPSLRCGSPLRSPLLRSWAPVRLPSVAASSRGRPLRGFGGGCLRPGAVGGPPGRLFRPRPRAFCPRVLRPLRRVLGVVRGVLPCAPPPRRPRWGLRGAGCLRLGAAAPAASQLPGVWVRGQAVRPTIVAARARVKPGGAAALALAAALFVAQGLDNPNRLRYHTCGLPVPVLRHPPARVSVGRRKNSGRNAGVLFLPVCPRLFAHHCPKP